MAPKGDKSGRKFVNKGAWTAEEDQKLAQFIEIHGAKRWKTIAAKAGLNRCGKSCRLRWLNYLRPNIKRGNFSEQEEDLILRLHKLLGNRWSLIAGRLPGRTDNDIKNYWNSHLSKKINCKEKSTGSSTMQESRPQQIWGIIGANEEHKKSDGDLETMFGSFEADGFFDLSSEMNFSLEWMDNFFELDESFFTFS